MEISELVGALGAVTLVIMGWLSQSVIEAYKIPLPAKEEDPACEGGVCEVTWHPSR